MDNYICIHGHFYQPPRENPWLEAIELQDSAYPYHDWNERITSECYAPNTAARIVDGAGLIEAIRNNYSRISFNFGPTLLAWLAENAPDIYRAVQRADRESLELYGGHGSAIAQGYNHMILPLANRRDKETQVRWGIRDFRRRFGRDPEGMWLPETAVDTETLEVLAAEGILFTILAPRQARRARPRSGGGWKDVSGERIDPTRAYECRLPSGRKISLFFYDGPTSRGIAFEGVLNRGEDLAGRLTGAIAEGRSWPQLVHAAVDGETFGHHHRFGDMALAYALHVIETGDRARLANYTSYLAGNPPAWLVQIHDNSSWSCVHGVERWKSDCGCNTGGHAGWNQQWRAPLREALDWLRDRAAEVYEEKGREYLKDPWAARDAYIDVVLDRAPESREAFLAAHAVRTLSLPERIRVWKLLELQRHAMLMYTSCGWFFDELSGIETVQVLQYAARAVQLCRHLEGLDLEPEFLERLRKAPSNIPEFGDGAGVYEKLVRPAKVDLQNVAAHYAVSLLFDSDGERKRIFGYEVERRDHRAYEAGRVRAVVGSVDVRSRITEDAARVSYAVLHLGDHNLVAGIRDYRGGEEFETMAGEFEKAFSEGDVTGAVRLLDQRFLDMTHSLKSLFRDEQRRILQLILDSALKETAGAFRQIYDHNAPLMRYLEGLGLPLPMPLRITTDFVLRTSVREAIEAPDFDPERVMGFVRQAQEEKASLDDPGLGLSLQKRAEKEMCLCKENPADVDRIARMERIVNLVRAVPFTVTLWTVENLYSEMRGEHWGEFEEKAKAGDPNAGAWCERMNALGGALHFKLG